MSGIPYTLPHAAPGSLGGLFADVDHAGGPAVALTRKGFPAFAHSGTPVDGPSGTWAGVARMGAVLLDLTHAEQYQNTGTQASPVWTLRSGGGSSIDGLSSDHAHGIDVEGPVNAGTAEPVVLSQPLTDLPHDIFADGAHNDTYIYVPFNSGSFDGIVGAAFLHGNHQHSTSPFTAWVNAAIVADNAGVPDPTTVLQTFGDFANTYLTSSAPASILMPHVTQTSLTFGDTGFDGPVIATIAGQTALTPNTPYWLQLSPSPASDYDGTNPTINLDGHVGSGALGNDDQATWTNALAWTPYVRLIAVTPTSYTASDTAPVPAAHVANPAASAGYVADTEYGSAFIGHSRLQVAIWGASDFDAGVQGESRHDIGVFGIGHGPDAAGGYFENDDPTGIALAAAPGQSHLQTLALTGFQPVTDTYPMTISDSIVEMNASAKTVTLPAANAAGVAPGRILIVKNGASGDTTTVATAGGTIDGASTKTLTAAFDVLRVYSNGTNWMTF